MNAITFPSTLFLGDSISETYTLDDYPASTYTLTVRLIPHTAGTARTITASASGDDHVVAATSATTGAWTAGAHSWVAYVTSGTDRINVGSGEITILANPASATSLDGRSHARRVLDAIEALLEDRATSDQKRIVIRDRELERFPVADLVKLRQAYMLEVKSEENAARISAGLAPRNRIYVRR